ncbi:unnamed protein product [Vitrella brassicaformis CCMP3155]|uniref:DNL-type domain-containing protein n=1 Tax=Vitrella brassicaformis (strain CCMP3155) TaxID=1169540 RepID=A0A0G4EPC5_VITBC|nr:unnamed protein product [Vitrella brassicaformis CCMP3155]|eukprot:CEL99010.1 unnamed protein product [Vitrella brassicaformis CCMP3155]
MRAVRPLRSLAVQIRRPAAVINHRLLSTSRHLLVDKSGGSAPSPAPAPDASEASSSVQSLPDVPGTAAGDASAYVIVFTCKKCDTRSAKRFAKKAYHEGIVVVRCDGCQSLHLVADHLAWFTDEESDIETMMAAKGEQVLRTLTEEHLLDVADVISRKQAAEESDSS